MWIWRNSKTGISKKFHVKRIRLTAVNSLGANQLGMWTDLTNPAEGAIISSKFDLKMIFTRSELYLSILVTNSETMNYFS